MRFYGFGGFLFKQIADTYTISHTGIRYTEIAIPGGHQHNHQYRRHKQQADPVTQRIKARLGSELPRLVLVWHDGISYAPD